MRLLLHVVVCVFYVCIVCELQGIEIFEFVKKYDYKLPIYYVKKIIQNTLKGLEHLQLLLSQGRQ